jgi:DNA-binding transcriptional MocR family regulator
MAIKEHRYERLARRVEEQIQAGALRVGDKARSLREFARLEQVSVLTALQAYTLLEQKGVLHARPRSGFYVASSKPPIISAPTTHVSALRPQTVATAVLIADVVTGVIGARLTSLAAAVPAPDLLPHRELNRIARWIMRNEAAHCARYHFPPGLAELREQVARHSVEAGCRFEPDDIVITSGGMDMDAVNLALKAVAKPGDLIAVESPTFFGLIQAVEAAGMRVIQVPTHAGTGIDINRLEHATKRHRIKACIVMSNCHNPVGSTMSDEDKRQLATLAADRGFTIIEDDAFGDLSYEWRRPLVVKKYDGSDSVILCGSFSKTIAPGLRIGWVHAGRYRDVIQRLKFLSSVAAPTLGQLVLAQFLRSGGYVRHLRRLR